MIGKLKGIIDFIGADHVIIDVGGVGYIVYASRNTILSLPQEGEAATLLIETHVREDHIHLYGFAGKEEKQWFGILTTVKGVGTKMALGILSALNPSQIATALMSKDKAAFTSVSGVGNKLAERLLTELKDKVPSVSDDPIASISESISINSSDKSLSEAISALTNLGYGRSDAYSAINKIAGKNSNMTVEDLIRNGLKELAS